MGCMFCEMFRVEYTTIYEGDGTATITARPITLAERREDQQALAYDIAQYHPGFIRMCRRWERRLRRDKQDGCQGHAQ